MADKAAVNMLLATAANLGFKPQEIDELKRKFATNPTSISDFQKQLDVMISNRPKPKEPCVVWKRSVEVEDSKWEAQERKRNKEVING